MEAITSKAESEVREKIKAHLDGNGIRYTWLAAQMSPPKQRSWVGKMLSGEIALLPENKKQIELILNIKL